MLICHDEREARARNCLHSGRFRPNKNICRSEEHFARKFSNIKKGVRDDDDDEGGG